MPTAPFSPSIIYEDSDILVINKPFGMITHPKDPKDNSYAVTTWLLERYPNIASVGEDPLRPGIVHRIDRDTSGLLVIAKTQEAFVFLKKLFQGRTIKKSYLTLVHGTIKDPSGIIDLPIGRIGIKRTTIYKKGKLKDAKEAITEYKTLKVFPNFSLLEVSPKTGRTHQIRVHLHAIGHPVCGDPVYGSKSLPPPLGLDRLFLHAWKLSFTSPSGRSLSLECDPPDSLTAVIATLDKEAKVR